MILYKYFLKENIIALVMVFLVIVAIVCTNEFSLYLNQAARGNLTIVVVCKLMLLQLPLMFAYLLPQSFYIGLLLVLARWYADNEMTILSSCGISYIKIFLMALSFAFMMMILSSWLIFVVDPKVESAENYLRLSTIADLSIAKLVPGDFRSFGNAGVIYAPHKSSVTSATLSGGVFLAQPKKINAQGQQTWNITYADSATQESYSKYLVPFLVFHHGGMYDVTPGNAKAITTTFADYGIKVPYKQNQINIWPQNATLLQLWAAKDHDLHAMSTLQWRISMPITIFILTLWAFPLSYTKPRKGKLSVLIPAIILYLGYADLLFMMRSSIAAGTISPDLGMWWVHALALLVGVLLWILRFGWWRTWFARV